MASVLLVQVEREKQVTGKKKIYPNYIVEIEKKKRNA